MNKNATELATKAMQAAVNHLEACEKGMIHHPFKSRSLPMLQAALGEIEKAPVLDREVAKKLVVCIVQHMERGSALLQPMPQVYMNDPYALLDLIKNEAQLKPEEIDAWMVEAQPDKKIKGKKS